jgi:hypothetical protein
VLGFCLFVDCPPASTSPVLESALGEAMFRALDGTLNNDLATALGITGGTLHKHWDNIFKELGVHSKDEARRRFMGVNPCPPGSV